jgi:hypothetical protein
MMFRPVLCLLLLLLPILIHGQEAPAGVSGADHAGSNAPPVSVLHEGGTRGAPSVSTSGIILPVRCDSSGAVYFRTYEPRETHRGVISISADGSKVVHYDVPDTPDYKGATVYDFFLSHDGKVIMPLQAGKKSYLLEFDDRGQIHATTPVEDTVWIAHAAAFDKGYLIMGLKQDDSEVSHGAGADSVDSQPKQQDYVAVFSDEGKRIRTLDSPVGGNAANGEQNANDQASTIVPGNQSVTFNSTPLSGPDGNVYILDRGDHPSLSEIKSSGEVAHHFAVAEPEPGFKASQLLLAPGKLAVVFLKTAAGQNDAAMISVLNPDGQETQRYAVAPDVVGIPACFDGQQFTFLGNKDGKALLRAAVAH